MTRPPRLVVVLGTGTEVGKTWVTCRLLEQLRAAGVPVAARKPAQSFDPGLAEPTDAELLAEASGERADLVCPPHRWYPAALAPPMAADRLHLPPVHLHDLVAELSWPAGTAIGVIETAGGVCSPIAHDGDGVALVQRVDADLCLLVADAGLGTIHAVRSSAAALVPRAVTVVLNRFDEADELHHANRAWLVERHGCDVVTDPAHLAARLAGV